MKRINRNKGSMTIEAAVIIPMTFFILLEIIFLSLFLYNRCCADYQVNSFAIKANAKDWYNNEQTLTMLQQEKESMSQGYLYEHDAEFTYNRGILNHELALRIHFNKYQYLRELKANKLEPVKSLRRQRKISQVALEKKEEPASEEKEIVINEY